MSPLHPFTTTSSKSLIGPSKHSNPLNRLFLSLLTLTAATLLATGCSSSVVGDNSGAVTGPAFVIGTDAPLASVTSFAVEIESIDAVTSTGTSVSLLSGTPTVDFARFNGLQTLLDMNDVPVGTYTSINVTLGPATIGYLNTSGAVPTIASEAATYTTTSQTPTIEIPLASPLIVSAAQPIGLRFDFDLAQSIQVSGGAITGQVTPNLDLKVVSTGDSGAYIDQFDAGVVSVDAAAQSFVVQGPHGRQFTVKVNGSTEWDNNDSISSLTTSSVVRLSGILDKTDATINADEVAILTQSAFYADGQVTYVTPATGTATSFDLYVRALLPANTGLTLGDIAQVNLTGSEKFFIYQMHNPLTQFLFNSSGLLAGQDVAIGGPASGATNPSAVTVNRISLHHWGYNGTVVPSSINTAQGTFQMQVTGFAGVLIPETVTVYTSTVTNFRGGLTSTTSLSNNEKVRVVGLLLKNPLVSGQAILLAHYVDELP
jgi:hypothetical protein